MRHICRWLLLITVMGVLLMIRGERVNAAESEENVSVTVSSQVSIVFNSNGTNTVSDFMIENNSPVPIHITNVVTKTYNGWALVSNNHRIGVDQKKLELGFQGQTLDEGDNFLQLTIPENEKRNPSITVRRGAWSKNYSAEKAVEISIEYALGKKGFKLRLEGAGDAAEEIVVYNGETVVLPTPKRIKYNFVSWEDENGVSYRENFLMPMKDVVLTAKWQWTEAYAIYTEEDQTLSFVRSVEPIAVGDIWQGKTVCGVYTEFEEVKYNPYDNKPPWWWDSYIERVIFIDEIQPQNTAYWFFSMHLISYLDVSNLEVSLVEDMTSMFSATGDQVKDKVTLVGIQDWNVSNVKRMGTLFRGLGSSAKTVILDDISKWDTSACVSMEYMFFETARSSSVYVDCSQWNVDNVAYHPYFSEQFGGTILEPKWKS